jgi:peptidyl-prolyl cis-trans isomerase D
VREFLANLNQMERAQRQQWINLEQYIKDDRKQQKFNNLITKAYYVPDSLAKMAYLEQGTTADIDYFGVKYQTVEDDEITITEEDYKNFYEENKHRFKNEKEQRNIEYVVFEVQATQEDINVIEKQVNELDEELAEIPLAEVPQFVNAVSDQPYDSSWKSRGELPARLENTMFTSDRRQGRPLCGK